MYAALALQDRQAGRQGGGRRAGTRGCMMQWPGKQCKQHSLLRHVGCLDPAGQAGKGICLTGCANQPGSQVARQAVAQNSLSWSCRLPWPCRAGRQAGGTGCMSRSGDSVSSTAVLVMSAALALQGRHAGASGGVGAAVLPTVQVQADNAGAGRECRRGQLAHHPAAQHSLTQPNTAWHSNSSVQPGTACYSRRCVSSLG